MNSTLSQVAAFMVVVWAGVFGSLLLFQRYQVKRGKAPARSRWLDQWDFSPEILGGFSYRMLILVSVLGLFLELLMIRWISSEIRIFAYFKNFVLIACFLGFGLGCYLCRRPISLAATAVPLALLAFIVHAPWQGLRELTTALPYYLAALSEVHMWGMPATAFNLASLEGLIPAVAIIVPLFALISLVFIPIGQMVGWYLENAANGILGYSVNVLGSLAGILLYTMLCFFYQPPAVWFAVAGAMLVLLLWKAPRLRWASAAACVICIALASWQPDRDKTIYWSPYQKLTLIPEKEAGKVIAYHLTTNGTWYQHIIDLSSGFVASHQHLLKGAPIEQNAYNLPYLFYPRAPSVLVLGAGMGNDVAAALRNGAGRVVAVEIDPLILEQGRRLHFEKPYDSPRVRQVVDDARSYIQNSRDRFDLIMFSLLDSHTTSSHFSNIRIDNYVYTVEALEAVKRLLEPDGVFIIKFQVGTPWIAGRLHGLLSAVFGSPPLQREVGDFYTSYTTAGRFFIAGSQPRIAQALSDAKLAGPLKENVEFKMEKATLTTDDWPYFYQHEPGLPASVLVISAILALVCWMAIRKTGAGVGSMRWHFFFLGAAFLLLEAQIISKMALLFGTTWMVNSIVIGCLLLLIVASNFLVQISPRLPVGLAYGGILVSIAVSYAVPLEKLFFESVWLKVVAAPALLCLPVFFAGIVFIQSFARAGFSGEALGSNLMGALVGGLLESLSLWTGIRSLLVMAALLYLASYLALRQEAPAPTAVPEAALAGD